MRGPAANFSLMLLAALGIHAIRIFHLPAIDPATGSPSLLLVVLEITFMLNLLLGTFNLLPVPPLDGSTAIMLLMDENRAQRYLDWIRGNNYAMAGLLVGLLVFQRGFSLRTDLRSALAVSDASAQ